MSWSQILCGFHVVYSFYRWVGVDCYWFRCIGVRRLDKTIKCSISMVIVIIWFAVQRPVNVKSRPRLPIPDEDPYSIAGNNCTSNENSDSSGYSGSSNSNGKKHLHLITKNHDIQTRSVASFVHWPAVIFRHKTHLSPVFQLRFTSRFMCDVCPIVNTTLNILMYFLDVLTLEQHPAYSQRC